MFKLLSLKISLIPYILLAMATFFCVEMRNTMNASHTFHKIYFLTFQQISRSCEELETDIHIQESHRVKSGKFGHQVNSDTHLQTV